MSSHESANQHEDSKGNKKIETNLMDRLTHRGSSLMATTRVARRGDYQAVIQAYLNNPHAGQVIPSLYFSAFDKPSRRVRIDLNGYLFVMSITSCCQIPALRVMLREHGHRIRKVSSRKKSSVRPFSYPADHRDAKDKAIDLTLDRNPIVFSAVVDYVHNQELHVPRNICPKVFARDLIFWGFSIDDVEPCCFAGLVHFLFEQDKLNHFHWFLYRKPQDRPSVGPYRNISTGVQTFSLDENSLRAKAWRILDEPFDSFPAKVYFVIMCIFILLSFFVIAASTHSYFTTYSHFNTSYQFNYTSETDNRSLPTIDDNNTTSNDTHVHQAFRRDFLEKLEYFSSSYLYLDYTLRIIFFPDLRFFFRDFVNVTDGLAVLSSVAKFASSVLFNSKFQWLMGAIDIMQLLRILRFLRPMSKMTWFRLMYFTLRCSYRDLLLVVTLLVFLSMIFSFLLYFLGDSFKSILEAMWYSLITMTTVGYGDVVPKDFYSMLIGSVVAVFGVIVMTMTTPIMVSNFHSLYINAIIGQPSTVKKLQKQLARRRPVSGLNSVSTASVFFKSLTGSLRRNSRRQSRNREFDELSFLGDRNVDGQEKDIVLQEGSKRSTTGGMETATSSREGFAQFHSATDGMETGTRSREGVRPTRSSGVDMEMSIHSREGSKQATTGGVQKGAHSQESFQGLRPRTASRKMGTSSLHGLEQLRLMLDGFGAGSKSLEYSKTVSALDVINETDPCGSSATDTPRQDDVVHDPLSCISNTDIDVETQSPTGAEKGTKTSSSSPSTASSGEEADKESGTDTSTAGDQKAKDVDDFNQNMLRRNLSLMRFRHRSWYLNYKTSDTDSDSDTSPRRGSYSMDVLDFHSQRKKARASLACARSRTRDSRRFGKRRSKR